MTAFLLEHSPAVSKGRGRNHLVLKSMRNGGTHLAEASVTKTNCDTNVAPQIVNCRHTQRSARTQHSHDDTSLGLPGIFRGSPVKILATAKVHIGEIWVVDDVEHHLDGTRSIVHYVYLKSQDGSKRLKIQSVFLQPYTG